MMTKIERLKGDLKMYYRVTRTPLLGLLVAFPLLVIYEVLSFTQAFDRSYPVRGFTDQVFRTLIENLGIHTPSAVAVAVLLGIFIAFLWQKESLRDFQIHHVPLMLLESMLYGLSMSILVTWFASDLTLSTFQRTADQYRVAIAFGAGFYEELLFRAFFFGVSALTLQKLFRIQSKLVYVVTALFSSMLFYKAHAFGGIGLAPYSRIFLFAFGMLLCGIYYKRGLGIAAWTHTIYNVFIIIA